MMRGSRTVVYRRGSIEIPFELVRSARRTLGISVLPGGTVRVRAPRHLSDAEVLKGLASRESWLLRQRERLRAHAPYPAPDWSGAPTLPLHGGWVRLALRDTPEAAGYGPSGRVRLSRDELVVLPSRSGGPWPPSPATTYRLVSNWYRERALEHFGTRMTCLQREPEVRRLGQPGDLAVRRMRRRWGSCFRDGRITLNTELVGEADDLVDYVLIHELCHLREFNHGPRFYAAMDRALPDWRERRTRLHASRISGFLATPASQDAAPPVAAG